jgi:signal transduction histidine kinase
MDASISALLAAARAHHGGSEVCRVDDALAQTARAARPPAGITVSVAPGEDRGEVAAPLELVVAVLKPLMENAVLHARHAVTLDAEVGADTVLLHVDDDGPGLSPELRDTAFDAGVSSREGGTGLGLPLAQRLARSAGGSVSAPDLPVSRFTVRLPRAWPSS